nr:endonuclease/exonuclease/phosphatase family protein [Pseudenhygromyxa sp. WMMC2535]
MPPAAPGEQVRVVSWNLENFRGDPQHHDLARMHAVVDELDADVLALQEVKDPKALAALLPGWRVAVSERGGSGHQRVAVAWRPERIEGLGEAIEHAELSLGGRVRPGLSMYLRGRGGGPDFWLTVVHLKAMPTGIDQRREQWPTLVALSEALAKRPIPAGAGDGRGGDRDRDQIVLGDFNSTGAPGAGPGEEHRELDAALAAAGLRRIENAGGCSAYYDGQRRDAWKEPSEIDLVWVRELGESLGLGARVHPGTHCAAHGCRDFRSTEAYPVRDYESVSDHCPVILDLQRADDD